MSLLEDADLLSPSFTLRVDQNLEGERVGLIRRDGRDVRSSFVDALEHLQAGLLQSLLHLSSVPLRLRLAPRTSDCDLDHPHFPYCLFVCFTNEPAALLALLLEELHYDGAAGRLGVAVLWAELG